MEKGTATAVETGSSKQDPAIPATCCLSEVSSMQVDEERVLSISVGPQGSLLIWDPEGKAVRVRRALFLEHLLSSGLELSRYPHVHHHSGSVTINFVADAVHLQQTYNIQGCSVGLYPRVPVQDTFLSLPIQLMPEEAAYLRDTNRARFVDANGLAKIPSLADGIAFADVRQEQVQQQVRTPSRCISCNVGDFWCFLLVL